MFVDSPFILAIVISGIIAAVLMLALWLGLERAIARRLVLGAIIPAVAVAVPAAIGLPETARGGVGAALLMLVLGGICGAIMDFSRLSERVSLGVAGVILLLGAWLVLAAPISGLSYHPGAIQIIAWLAFLIVGGCFLWVTRPEFSEDDDEVAKPTRGKKTKTAKPKASKADAAVDIINLAKPGPVAVLMTLALGQGIIVHLFGLSDFVVLQAALTVALIVAVISEKAAPQYRVAVWLGVVGALMAAAASAMIIVPASCLAFAVLLLVVSGRQASVRLATHLPSDNPAQAVLLGSVIKVGVLALPLIIAALVAYVGAEMAARAV
ncbi:hypothetical protein UF64_15385 [Thalassospira sp. HJ]|uniref:hypothetical protein n=1 Tax=Thalassospira sp. HJ TaxID=1616823 RepID=UPI0005CE3AD6|nr:hypothetical protein [Thalassospira sp. HJ]KJE34445.1 hypothetical protein UF64_15385 [Thalassospira sp. HJ]